ncbi:MAG: DUF5615 family PIN-like protein [Waterburya sp.]
MSQISLYLDEDTIQKGLVKALGNAAVDVTTTASENRLGFSDESQLIWAAKQGRVIYTFNVQDFCQLHSIFLTEKRNHAGIILGTQQRYSIGQQLRGILRLIATKSAEEMINQLEFLGNYLKTK